MRGSRKTWGLLAVLVSVGLLYSFLPLGTAVQFGGDEGYELMTGFLMQKGYVLYHQIWNDQPPLLVLLLSWLFKAFGPSILAARLLAAAFGLSMFAIFYRVVCERAGIGAGLAATFLLLASPAVLEISVSVMQEVPAFALALASVLLLFQWRKKPHWGWLLASGAMMAAALEIKFTAALAIPAMLVEILLSVRSTKDTHWQRKAVAPLAQWGVGLVTVFALITLIWARGSFQSTYRAHFVEHANSEMGRPEDFPVPIGVFAGHAECVIAAVMGILLILRQRRTREFAFPLVMLATAICVHTFHRPWWMYYYVHFAIPMAWLGGFAVGEVGKSAIPALISKPRKRQSSLSARWKPVGLAVLIALAFVRSELRIEGGMKDLRGRMRIANDPIIAKMKQYAPQTRWAYVHYGNEIYPFHAGLLMPPELALVTLKRFWSGQISEEEIMETCGRYRVDQLLLSPSEEQSWPELSQDYIEVTVCSNLILNVAKRQREQ